MISIRRRSVVFYVRCASCGRTAPARAIAHNVSLRAGGPILPVAFECGMCSERQPYLARDTAHCNTPVRCRQFGCWARFLVPASADIIRCPRCGHADEGVQSGLGGVWSRRTSASTGPN